MYQVTREQIVTEARSLLGVPFLHQGRNPQLGLDCVGLCVEIARRVDYPEIIDLEAYKRTPSASDLLELLRANLDEIDLSEVGIGDVYLMKMGGAKPRHVAIKTSEKEMVHALSSLSIKRVIEQNISLYRPEFVRGFRLRGLVI